jgi:hypothetical protein
MLTARGVASAVARPEGLSDMQRVLIEAIFASMIDHPVDLVGFEPMSTADLAKVLRRRDLRSRTRTVQVIALCALVLRPVPSEVSDRIEELARLLGVDDGMIGMAWLAFPGLPASPPPLLAQHDWVHVLADYGTTVESEMEVFALIAGANEDLRALSLLAMVSTLFESGAVRTGAGLFEAAPGHLADAMRRGARCRDVRGASDSVDFLGVDWFHHADLPIEEARACFRFRPSHRRRARRAR